MLIVIFITANLISSISMADGIPQWAQQDSQRRSGNTYGVICSGDGPSIDLARSAATESCHSSATQQLKTNITVKALSVETERDVAFHQEVSQETQFYEGLSCLPEKEAVETQGNSFRVWLMCRYNLEKVKIVTKPSEANAEPRSGSMIENKGELTKVNESGRAIATGRYLKDKNRTLTIASIPPCSELIVRGNKPAKVVQCVANPMPVIIGPDESEIVVRARGYLSKTISLSNRKDVDDDVQVVLEPSD
jgi:hypothetical protein